MAKLKMTHPGLRTVDTRTVRPTAKVRDAYYVSAEHLSWRTRVIAEAGGRCQRCGVKPAGRIYADHIVEIRDGGDPQGPGQALCGSCHTTKTAEARGNRAHG